VFIIVSVLLTAIWFRRGYMLAWAEGGIPFYNPSKDFFSTHTAWFEYQLGTAAPTVVSSSPFYLLLSFFQAFGVAPVITQMITFLILLVIQGVGMSLLSQEFFGRKSTVVGLTSGLFYMLNPISMVIWHKFLLTFIFAYSAYPVVFYTFLKMLKERRYAYGFAFAVTTVIFSYGLSSPLFIIPLWLSLLVYAVFFVTSNRSLRVFLFTVRAISVTLFLWFALNAWWILQMIPSAEYQFALGFSSTPSGDLNTLNVISINYHSSPDYLLRLVYWFYMLNDQQVTWSWFYSNEAVIVLGLVPLLLGLIALVFEKRRVAVFPSVLLGVIIFLSKGSGPPLGELFLWLFTNFSLFRVFRNPVETFGSLIPLAYAPLVGIGVLALSERLALRLCRYCSSPQKCRLPGAFGKALAFCVAFPLISVYVFPMWTGAVFTTSSYYPTSIPRIGYNVAVPNYYLDVNAKMQETSGLYRVMVLPLNDGGITYSWTYGYNGGDISDELYNVPAVSQSLTYSLFGTPYLTSSINTAAVSDPINFWKIVAITNSRFVVISGDINATDRSLVDPKIISSNFNGSYSPSASMDLVDQNSTLVSKIPATMANIAMAWADTTSYTYSLEVSQLPFPQGNQTVIAKAYPADGNIGVWIQIPENMTDITSHRFLQIWIRGSQGGPPYIEVDDAEGHSATWDGRLNPNYVTEANTWKLLVLPLDVPSQIINKQGSLNRANITRILVGMSSLDHVQTDLQIGGIFLDQGVFSGRARNLNFIGQFGELSLYQLNSSVFLPRIYAVSNFTIADTFGAFMSDISNFDSYNSVLMLSSELQRHSAGPKREIMSNPKLTFSMKSPSEYEATVNSSGPFMLVLSETYNPGWVVEGPEGRIAEDNHFIVNGYANMWYIDRHGDYKLRIYFGPNIYMKYWIWISVIVFLVTAITIFHGYLKKLMDRLLSLARFAGLYLYAKIKFATHR